MAKVEHSRHLIDADVQTSQNVWNSDIKKNYLIFLT